MTDWQNRITAYKQIPANQLLANPDNARRHPARQREALRGSLDALGWIAPVIVNVNNGNHVLDGHARIEEALTRNEDMLLPVLEVDLSEDEEKLFLASFDYITYMADYDRDALDTLLTDLQADDSAMSAIIADDSRLENLLSELAAEHGLAFGDDPNAEWVGMPEFDNEGIKPFHSLILYFKTASDMEAFAELVQQVITEKIKYLYYPKQENQPYIHVQRVIDES